MDHLLETHNLVVGYKERALLPPLNINVRPGELIGLLGANGAGKSTLLRTIAATQKALSGSINVAGDDINNLSTKELARKIAIVYTDRITAGGLTVRQVVALGRHPHISALGKLSHQDKEIIERAMERVGIEQFADRYLSHLSDGEKQKVMIARTLAQETPIIILDEPTTFLDVASRLELFNILGQLADEEGKGIIVSTHEVAPAVKASSRLWLITYNHDLVDDTPGNLIASGTINHLFSPSRGVVYDGSDFIIA